MGAHFKKYFCIFDFFAPIHRDVGVVDNSKCVHPFDALVVWDIGALDYNLAQLAKFVGVQLIPILLILGIFPKLYVFEGLYHFFIKYRFGPVKGKLSRVTSS